jgi:hypothetical protein
LQRVGRMISTERNLPSPQAGHLAMSRPVNLSKASCHVSGFCSVFSGAAQARSSRARSIFSLRHLFPSIP